MENLNQETKEVIESESSPEVIMEEVPMERKIEKNMILYSFLNYINDDNLTKEIFNYNNEDVSKIDIEINEEMLYYLCLEIPENKIPDDLLNVLSNICSALEKGEKHTFSFYINENGVDFQT